MSALFRCWSLSSSAEARCPACRWLKLREMFPTQERGTRLGAEPDQTKKVDPDLGLLWLSCCPSNAAAEEVSGRNLSWHCNLWLLSHSSPLHPDLHHRGLSLQQGTSTRENAMSGFFFLADLSATFSLGSHESPPSSLSALGQGSTTPGAPVLKPRHWATGVLQTVIGQTGSGHFAPMKEGLCYPLVAPRRPDWDTSAGVFSNLITYPCLKLFMVH